MGPFLRRAAEKSWRNTPYQHYREAVLAISSECFPAQGQCPIVVVAKVAPEALVHFSCSLLWTANSTDRTEWEALRISVPHVDA